MALPSKIEKHLEKPQPSQNGYDAAHYPAKTMQAKLKEGGDRGRLVHYNTQEAVTREEEK
jgi:hypothetical protein